MKSRSRRAWLKRAGAVALAPYVITARSQETLIVNTQGGEYQELVERVVIHREVAQHAHDVRMVEAGQGARLLQEALERPRRRRCASPARPAGIP